MSRVLGKDTTPELRVRKTARALGLKFRLHPKNLAGTPDLVFPEQRLVVFVHGCFWHRHAGCKKAGIPKSKKKFWIKKFEQNVKRDRRNFRSLRSAGWMVATIWECQTKAPNQLLSKLSKTIKRSVKSKARRKTGRKVKQ